MYWVHFWKILDANSGSRRCSSVKKWQIFANLSLLNRFTPFKSCRYLRSHTRAGVIHHKNLSSRAFVGSTGILNGVDGLGQPRAHQENRFEFKLAQESLESDTWSDNKCPVFAWISSKNFVRERRLVGNQENNTQEASLLFTQTLPYCTLRNVRPYYTAQFKIPAKFLSLKLWPDPPDQSINHRLWSHWSDCRVQCVKLPDSTRRINQFWRLRQIWLQ